MDHAEEHRILLENLVKALEEASQKTKDTLSLEGKSPRDREMIIWMAMEAVEYTSFLFAVTYDYEDEDPATPPTKGMDLPSLMKESARAIEQVKSSPSNEKL